MAYVGDASHRSAVEAVEERLFVVTVSNPRDRSKPLFPQVTALIKL
jgi:hypothetical protein